MTDQLICYFLLPNRNLVAILSKPIKLTSRQVNQFEYIPQTEQSLLETYYNGDSKCPEIIFVPNI
ncbi:hypothetical protein [Nostoc parmelioides]|uniref:hypothetical protein n=1 Tax=Nostoc parmelioides TaxID=1521621 RepID=UPI0016889CFA|nr:hypothetical protein [Nostoc parmelioides]